MDFTLGRAKGQDSGRRRTEWASSAEGTSVMLMGIGKLRAGSRNKGLRWRAEVIEERSSENKRQGSLNLKSLVLFGRNWGPPGGFRAAW